MVSIEEFECYCTVCFLCFWANHPFFWVNSFIRSCV